MLQFRSDLSAAIACARRWLGLDQLYEQAHRPLMTLYAQFGQRSAAIQQYRDCVPIRSLLAALGRPFRRP